MKRYSKHRHLVAWGILIFGLLPCLLTAPVWITGISFGIELFTDDPLTKADVSTILSVVFLGLGGLLGTLSLWQFYRAARRGTIPNKISFICWFAGICASSVVCFLVMRGAIDMQEEDTIVYALIIALLSVTLYGLFCALYLRLPETTQETTYP